MRTSASGRPTIERGLGYLRVYDLADPADPVQIGAYRTPIRSAPARWGRDYSIHNTLVVGTTLYSLLVFGRGPGAGCERPDQPRRDRLLRAAGRPEPGQAAPAGHVVPDAAGVGGVLDSERDLVLASDMNTGLWILRVTA